MMNQTTYANLPIALPLGNIANLNRIMESEVKVVKEFIENMDYRVSSHDYIILFLEIQFPHIKKLHL